MITELQQAKKLINRFKGCAHGEIGSEQLYKNCRKSALICADKILETIFYIDENVIKRDEEYRLINEFAYWKEVKKEILKSTYNGR